MPEDKTIIEKEHVTIQFRSILQSETNRNRTTLQIWYGKILLSHVRNQNARESSDRMCTAQDD